MYVYVHNYGEFLDTSSRSQLFPLEVHKYENIVDMEVEVTISLPTHQIKCDKSMFVYDQCVATELLNKKSELCLLPFLALESNLSMCHSFHDGLQALDIFNSQQNNCMLPCTQTKVEFSLNPSRNIYSNINPNTIVSENPGYNFAFPPSVTVSEMTEAYDIVSYVAEFGGWAGLFIGISFLGLYSLVNQILCRSLKHKAFKSGLYLMELAFSLGGSLILCFVCYTSVSKLIRDDIENDIGLMKDISNLQLSICSEESTYENTDYMGNNPDFWKNGSDISKALSYIQLDYKNGTIQNYDLDQLQIHNLLNTDLNVEFCNTIPDISHVRQMKISTHKEIFFYLHLKQQFFGNYGKTRITAFPTKSFDGLFFKNRVTLKLNLIYTYRVGTTINNEDDCIMNSFPFKNITPNLRPTGINDITNGMDEDIVRSVIHHLMQEDHQCPTPYANIKASYVTELEKFGDILDVNTNNISRNNLGTTPNAEILLLFPDIGMFYKVSLNL